MQWFESTLATHIENIDLLSFSVRELIYQGKYDKAAINNLLPPILASISQLLHQFITSPSFHHGLWKSSSQIHHIQGVNTSTATISLQPSLHPQLARPFERTTGVQPTEPVIASTAERNNSSLNRQLASEPIIASTAPTSLQPFFNTTGTQPMKSVEPSYVYMQPSAPSTTYVQSHGTPPVPTDEATSLLPQPSLPATTITVGPITTSHSTTVTIQTFPTSNDSNDDSGDDSSAEDDVGMLESNDAGSDEETDVAEAMIGGSLNPRKHQDALCEVRKSVQRTKVNFFGFLFLNFTTPCLSTLFFDFIDFVAWLCVIYFIRTTY